MNKKNAEFYMHEGGEVLSVATDNMSFEDKLSTRRTMDVRQEARLPFMRRRPYPDDKDKSPNTIYRAEQVGKAKIRASSTAPAWGKASTFVQKKRCGLHDGENGDIVCRGVCRTSRKRVNVARHVNRAGRYQENTDYGSAH